MIKKYLLGLMLIVVLFSLRQAHGAIITDRPDFTESSATVPRLFLQSELGVDYSTLGPENALAVPNLLVRFGLLRFLELRLGVPSYVASFTGDSTVHDVDGLEFGAKVAFSVGKMFSFGLLPYVVVPVRPAHYDDGAFEAGFKFTWALALGRIVSLSGNLGVFGQRLAAPMAPIPGYLASLSLGIGITRRTSAFFELYTVSLGNDHFRPVANTGLAFLVTARFQMDAYFGVGLNQASKGINPGAGMSFIF